MLPLRVLVVDDHRLFRQGLIGLMRTRPDLVDVIGEASSGSEALQLIARLHPDIVLMDIQMPDGDGLETAACVRQHHPGVAVVMLTASESDDHLFQAMRLGAAGYLLKDLDADELFNLLGGLERGEAVMTRAMSSRLLRQATSAESNPSTDTLTEREIDVLRLVALGASNPQIADELVISVNTVKVHLRNILDKLCVENRAQAAVYAVRWGLLPRPEEDSA